MWFIPSELPKSQIISHPDLLFTLSTQKLQQKFLPNQFSIIKHLILKLHFMWKTIFLFLQNSRNNKWQEIYDWNYFLIDTTFILFLTRFPYFPSTEKSWEPRKKTISDNLFQIIISVIFFCFICCQDENK